MTQKKLATPRPHHLFHSRRVICCRGRIGKGLINNINNPSIIIILICISVSFSSEPTHTIPGHPPCINVIQFTCAFPAMICQNVSLTSLTELQHQALVTIHGVSHYKLMYMFLYAFRCWYENAPLTNTTLEGGTVVCSLPATVLMFKHWIMRWSWSWLISSWHAVMW